MALTTQISKLLDGVREAIVQDQKDKGMVSSGKSAASIKKQVDYYSGKLLGASYFFQQKFGRRPGKFPPISAMLDYIREKGITPRDPKTSERQLAFLFARKIAREGTSIFQGTKSGLSIEDKMPKLLSDFKKDVIREFKVNLIGQIKK